MDKFLRDSLRIIFNETSAQKIINDYLSPCKNRHLYKTSLGENFETQMKNSFKFLSPNEIANVTMGANSMINDEKLKNCGIFKTIIDFSLNTLTENDGYPVVKFDELLRFRDTTHSIGSEIFIGAFLAYKDYEKNRNYNRVFDYKTSIQTDNTRLHNMLKSGLAENHFHIKGSTPAFLLSWLCLMNNITQKLPIFIKAGFEKSELNGNKTFYENKNANSYYSLIFKATAIRLFLFSKLKGYPDFWDIDTMNSVLGSNANECNYMANELQRKIDINKCQYGKTSKIYGICMDYAIKKNNAFDKTYEVFSGEREFLYLMFRALLENNHKVNQYFDLFYIYLLISIQFRGELVQINNRVGFANFADYQDRKDIFIKNHKQYKDALVALALYSNLSETHIKSVEARFVPKNSPGRGNELHTEIAAQIKHFNDLNEINKIGNREWFLRNHHLIQDTFVKDERLFYVAHFPKSKYLTKKKGSEIYFRHFQYRRDLKKQAVAIADMRNRQCQEACDLFAIDACAHEIGCRPEVFAQAFRFLKNHQISDDGFYNCNNMQPPQLKITYHVGEDFLDVADGLRAIDEVINFLDISRGDRLGHALALGIEPKEWYYKKRQRIILSRQDLLDNAVWMMGKLIKYGYSHLPVYNELNEVYMRNVIYIFQQNLPFQLKDVSINIYDYQNAYSLRGDNPQLYFDCNDPVKYLQYLNFGNFFEDNRYNLFSKNKPEDPLLNEIRLNNVAAYKLIHHYHFNPKVKLCGNEMIEHYISHNYIEAVKIIQERMLFEIAQKGIGIECNPSSNVLIGTFERYDKHPIIKFNNKKLSTENNAKLLVSINTDDLGVFDTCLENEYALMACALQKAVGDDGNLLYSPDDINDYLDMIRKMGIEQSFKINT